MKKGLSEGFQGYCLSNRELALGCNSSLPYRQLRNKFLAFLTLRKRSLPYRQLRKMYKTVRSISLSSLPYRQLRKQGILNPF